MSHRFYTDPLAAAWMAKHFGMRFSPMLDTGEVNCACQYPQRGVYTQEWEPMPPSWGRYYIHPDSVLLLEPQVGDIVVRRADQYVLPDSVTQIDDKGDLYTASLDVSRKWIGNKAGSKIIQRDGLPFFWPESEEA